MKTPLKSDQETLQVENDQLKKQVISLSNDNKWLKERIAWFERQIFGKSSERNVDPENDDMQYLDGFEVKESEEEKEEE